MAERQDPAKSSKQVRAKRGAERASKTDAPQDQARDGAGAGKSPAVAADAQFTAMLEFPLVAVGSSAGGLEAFTELLQGLPPKPGVALIYVTHLHPDYRSALAEILTRETPMKVVEIDDQMPIVKDTVYVTRPACIVDVSDSHFRVQPSREHTERHLPIDHLFRSLATAHGGRAIGVILSGTASDGVMGLREIKARGGVAIAQTPASAKYDGMPSSAIAAGTVDLVLSPEEIAAELVRLSLHPYLAKADADADTEETETGAGADTDDYSAIFSLLRKRKGNDFSYYKPSTVRRRIRRRMVVNKLDDLNDYVKLLQQNNDEVEALFRDLLINVTEFFREPETFDGLKRFVYPSMLDRATDIPIRIWVPGCSTGEEAYSIAISLVEYLGDLAPGTPVQIFATDLDEEAIQRARNGIYPESISQQVSLERLRRFFYRIDKGYQIIKSIRDLCVFAVQNITKDPPFSHIDLISCRNLLIYMGPTIQQRAIPMFHFALRPGGFLMLGSAESAGSFSALFQVVDQRLRIYSKKESRSHPHFDFLTPTVDEPPPASSNRQIATSLPDENLRLDVDRMILARFAPPCVLIDEQYNIMLFRGRTGPFLEPLPGTASLNLLRMVRQDLVVDLSAMLKESAAKLTEVHRDNMALRESQARLRITVVPIPEPMQGQLRFLVVFQELLEAKALPDSARAAAAAEPVEGGKDAQTLEAELVAMREYLRSLVERQESSNEELRSANEEVQSSNEELQSINEELETAKEELQSTNEELATVNEELEARNSELAQVNDDLNNLISSVGIPIIIVGPDLRIRRFTPMISRLLNLIPTDVGRPIGDIKSKIAIPDFEEKLEEVVYRLHSVDVEARDENQRCYSVRMHPYRTLDNKIDGAVVAFIDITELNRALEWERGGRTQAEAVVRASIAPQVLLDSKLTLVAASKGFTQTFTGGEELPSGLAFMDVDDGYWAEPGLAQKLKAVLSQGETLDAYSLKREVPARGSCRVQIDAQVLPQINDDEQPRLLLQFAVSASDSAAAASPSA